MNTNDLMTGLQSSVILFCTATYDSGTDTYTVVPLTGSNDFPNLFSGTRIAFDLPDTNLTTTPKISFNGTSNTIIHTDGGAVGAGAYDSSIFDNAVFYFDGTNWRPDPLFVEVMISKRAKRNYFKNPTFQVSQENGDGPNNLSFLNNVWGADLYLGYLDMGVGGTHTVTRGTQDNRRTYKVTAATAATDLTGSHEYKPFIHCFEGNDVYHLNGKLVTIGFNVWTNWSGNLAVTVRAANGSRTYNTDVAVVSGKNSCRVTLNLESNSVNARDANTQIRVYLGGCNEGVFESSVIDEWSADGADFCTTNSTMWCKTTNQYVEFGDMQMVEGDHLPYLEENDYDYDVSKCTRYFEVLNYGTNGLVAIGQCISTTATIGMIDFTKKRAAPTLSVGSGSLVALNSSGSSAGGSPTFLAEDLNTARVSISSATGLVAGNASGISCTPSTAEIHINSRLT